MLLRLLRKGACLAVDYFNTLYARAFLMYTSSHGVNCICFDHGIFKTSSMSKSYSNILKSPAEWNNASCP